MGKTLTSKLSPVVPKRKITGISAILLPFKEDYSVDWAGFEAHVARTDKAGLLPAVNMDTGYADLIDMVIYGSDYLLGLSSFAPDLFGYRDRLWEEGNADFYQLNDILQYLGFFAFRHPVPAYKHSAAQFLKLQGWLDCDHTHPNSQTRPDSDIEILKLIVAECSRWRETI